MDTNTSSPAKRRVLIVDAKAGAAESLATLLRALGHEVRMAPDGWRQSSRPAASAPRWSSPTTTRRSGTATRWPGDCDNCPAWRAS